MWKKAPNEGGDDGEEDDFPVYMPLKGKPKRDDPVELSEEDKPPGKPAKSRKGEREDAETEATLSDTSDVELTHCREVRRALPQQEPPSQYQRILEQAAATGGVTLKMNAMSTQGDAEEEED